MKHASVQRGIEEYVQANWTSIPTAFDNVPFNSDLYDEFVQCNVAFGPSRQVGIENWFRVTGIVMMTVHVKPGVGNSRMLQLAEQLALLLNTKQLLTVPPNDAPPVQFLTASITTDLKDVGGWVRAQVDCPFYYTLEI